MGVLQVCVCVSVYLSVCVYVLVRVRMSLYVHVHASMSHNATATTSLRLTPGICRADSRRERLEQEMSQPPTHRGGVHIRCKFGTTMALSACVGVPDPDQPEQHVGQT